MACEGANAVNRADASCIYSFDIPERYRRGGDRITDIAQSWLESDEATGYFTFDRYVGVWATRMLFSDENTAIFFKLRFG